MDTPFDAIQSPSEVCSLDGNWWVFAMRGVLAVLFGLVAMFMPGTALLALTILFGVFSLMDGIFHLVSGINRAREHGRWGGLVGSGILGVGTGLVVLVMPLVATLGLVLFLWTAISAWAVTIGILELAAAFRLGREGHGGRLFGLVGLLSTGLGVAMAILLFRRPMASLPAIGTFIGLYFLVSGCMLLRFGWLLCQRARLPVGGRRPGDAGGARASGGA